MSMTEMGEKTNSSTFIFQLVFVAQVFYLIYICSNTFFS